MQTAHPNYSLQYEHTKTPDTEKLETSVKINGQIDQSGGGGGLLKQLNRSSVTSDFRK